MTVKPDLTTKAGYYTQSAIKFSYEDYPKLHFNVTVIAIIEECIVESAQFAISHYQVSYYIGQESIKQGLPKIDAKPDCELTI